MSKHDLILTISKKRSEKGNYFFSIGDNFDSGFHEISLPNGVLPEMGTSDHEYLAKCVDNTLVIIFLKVANKLPGKTNITHKCIFSDKYISNGMCSISNRERIETYNEMTLPMNQAECDFFFFRIPRII